jgi:ATP-dependent DNA ligase
VPNEKGVGYDIVTTYGEQGGRLIEKRANVPKGKAGRTVIEQVTQEATKRFQDKKEKENYREELTDDTVIDMRPMLAQTYTPDKTGRGYKMQFPLWVQPKLDGIRCIAHYIPGTPITLISRKGTAFQNFAHIENRLLECVEGKTDQELYIDGELYSNEMTFEKISGLVRSQTLSKGDHTTIKKIQYHIYDIYVPSQPKMGYSNRYESIRGLFGVATSPPITTSITPPITVLVETVSAKSATEIPTLHQHYVEMGYEGIMLRDTMGEYEIDKRSKYLQKYKTFMEEEFPIVGYTEEDGMIIFQCKTRDNREFSARPRGTFETRREMFVKGDEFIGKLLTVIFQEYTELGVPRFPVGKTVRDYE